MTKFKVLPNVNKLLFVVLVFIVFPVRNFCASTREKLNIKPADAHSAVDASEVLTTHFLGPLRAFANMSIWSRASSFEEEGEYFELRALYKLALKMQPRNAIVYGYISDLFIYTIARRMYEDEPRWQSVLAGLKFIEDGLKKMPASWELHSKRASFFQTMTGEIPVKIIGRELKRENSLFRYVPEWREQAVALLEKIEKLPEDEKVRFKNFARNHGQALIYTRNLRTFPRYNSLSPYVKQLISEVNVCRARLSFLSNYDSFKKIGARPYLSIRCFYRAFDVFNSSHRDLDTVLKLCAEIYRDIKSRDLNAMRADKKSVYQNAIATFEELSQLKARR